MGNEREIERGRRREGEREGEVIDRGGEREGESMRRGKGGATYFLFSVLQSVHTHTHIQHFKTIHSTAQSQVILT